MEKEGGRRRKEEEEEEACLMLMQLFSVTSYCASCAKGICKLCKSHLCRLAVCCTKERKSELTMAR